MKYALSNVQHTQNNEQNKHTEKLKVHIRSYVYIEVIAHNYFTAVAV